MAELRLSKLDPEEKVLPASWKSIESEVESLVSSAEKNQEKIKKDFARITEKISSMEEQWGFEDRLRKIFGQIQEESDRQGIIVTEADLERLDLLQKEIVSLEKQLSDITQKKKEKGVLLKERKEKIQEYNKYLNSIKEELTNVFNNLLSGDGAILNNTMNVDIETQFASEEYLEVIRNCAKHDLEEKDSVRFPNRNALIKLFKQLGSDKIIASFDDGSFSDWQIEGIGQESLSFFNYIENKEEVGMRLQELLPTLSFHLYWRPDQSREFKPLKRCSIGERGTALLSIILVSGREPLIIDQPEDDLDHFYLSETLTPIIKEVKKRRQLIFATHDANIVVNCDAELIIIVKAEVWRIISPIFTTIEETENRSKIVEVLEGGVRAFEQRSKRYNLSLLKKDTDISNGN
ncbi:hypothetical protein MYX76_02485 [Desulfobacterota bacterium AH_259_B03_O07]|nr:hypothetical protein [Desulfobacterota bacterium AH_259_B03_O07]